MSRQLICLMIFAVACGGKTAPEPAATAAVSAADGAPIQLSNDERIARAAALLTTRTEADAQSALLELQPLLVAEPDRADIPFNMGCLLYTSPSPRD